MNPQWRICRNFFSSCSSCSYAHFAMNFNDYNSRGWLNESTLIREKKHNSIRCCCFLAAQKANKRKHVSPPRRGGRGRTLLRDKDRTASKQSVFFLAPSPLLVGLNSSSFLCFHGPPRPGEKFVSSSAQQKTASSEREEKEESENGFHDVSIKAKRRDMSLMVSYCFRLHGLMSLIDSSKPYFSSVKSHFERGEEYKMVLRNAKSLRAIYES
jgi:hypothetical protein